MNLWQATQKAATSLALIVVIALAARVAFAWNQSSKIPHEALATVPFQQETGNIAFALAEGKGFSNVFRTETGPTAWLAPVYPLILAGIFKLFGVFTVRAFAGAVAFNILCSSAACMPIFYAGKRLWGLGVAAGAAWLWAIFPNGILIPFEWIWDTSLSALLAAVILWVTLALAESKRVRDWCGYGLLWGFALLTNPALGALLPFLLVWAARGARGARRARWSRAGLAAAVAILCCVPWTVRNYVAFHRFIPLRSNLAFELWSGNNDVFNPDARGGRRVMTRFEEVRRYAQIGETAYMREKWELATAFIKTHTALEGRLTWRRLLNFWLGTDAPLRSFRETNSNLIRAILGENFVTTAGAFLGIVALWWKERKTPRPRVAAGESGQNDDGDKIRAAFLPLAAYPVIFPLLYYVTHAYLRLRHPIDPVVMLLTTMAVAGIWVAIRGNKYPKV